MFKIIRIVPIVVVLGFSSCIIAILEDPAGAPSWMRNSYEETLPLSPGGVVQVENTRGSIHIEGWDREEVNIMAENPSGYPFRPGMAWLRSSYRPPEIELDRFEDFITVKPERLEGEEEDTIDFFIRVPRFVECKRLFTRNGDITITDVFGRASVEVETGDIEVLNFSGSLSLMTREGTITVELYDLHPDDVITLWVEQGDLIVYLQPEVNASIEGATPSGELKSAFDGETRLEGDDFFLQLGTEGAKLSLTTGEGNIMIEKIKVMPDSGEEERVMDSGTI